MSNIDWDTVAQTISLIVSILAVLLQVFTLILKYKSNKQSSQPRLLPEHILDWVCFADRVGDLRDIYAITCRKGGKWKAFRRYYKEVLLLFMWFLIGCGMRVINWGIARIAR